MPPNTSCRGTHDAETSATAIATNDAAANRHDLRPVLSGKDGTAIDVQQEGFVYARNITAEQFGNVVTVAGQDLFVGKNSVVEWSSHEYRVGNEQRSWTEGNDNVGLNLPVKQAPEFFNADFSTWANVTDFGATADTAVAPQRGGGQGSRQPAARAVAAPSRPRLLQQVVTTSPRPGTSTRARSCLLPVRAVHDSYSGDRARSVS